jgi:hypothetical protein
MSNEPPQDASIGDLVTRMSEQTSRLIRDEFRLAQAEMMAKGKRAGIGVGMFGGAGLFAFFGFACLITAAILGLARRLPDWAAAIVIGVVLFAAAGIAAFVGKREVSQAGPPLPEQAVSGLKQDVEAIQPGSHR